MLPVPFSGHPVYAAVFIVTYAGWFLFETIVGLSRRSRDPKGTRDRGSYRLLIAMIWTGIGLDFGCCFGLQRAAIHWLRTEVFVFGIAVMWAGLAFRYCAMRALGRYFTCNVAVHAGQTLVEAGPYRYVRHPSYTGAIVTIFGFGLALGNWAGLLAILTCMGIGYAYRIHVEESALVAALGEPYKAYTGRTRRLLPFVF